MTTNENDTAPRVGDRYRVERRSTGGMLVDVYEAPIVRVTPKRAYFSQRSYFRLDDPNRKVLPRYIDYTTTARPVAPTESDDAR